MKHIILDPGHGGAAGKDHFRQGPGGEREEWINLIVAKELEQQLKAKGFLVTLTRRRDLETELNTRTQLAKDSQADLFVSIHHASCDPAVSEINFPFFYIHKQLDSEAKKQLVSCFKQEFSKAGHGSAIGYSDFWVFNDGLYVLRECEKNNIPAILTEFSFFSNPQEELKLKSREYCKYEASFICAAIVNYFSNQGVRNEASKEFALEANNFPLIYKKQLEQIKEGLAGSVSWRQCIAKAESEFESKNYQNSVIEFEKALSLNPYHQEIKEQLKKMIICTKNMDAQEYQQNLQALLINIF